MGRVQVDYRELLDVFLWGLDKLTRPTLSNLLAGYEEFAQRPEHRELLQRLERQRLLHRQGRGAGAVFTITETGRQRLAAPSPQRAWQQPWDGGWRAITFDVPESRRKDRKVLWRALRAHRLGLLQRSVWVWPHPLEPVIRRIIKAEGVPECFCGLEIRGLFLCTNEEVVASSWNWEEIGRRHQSYLNHPHLSVADLKSAADLARLTRLARQERAAYEFAFSFDPFLPQQLWPRAYRGAAVEERHREFRHTLTKRLSTLADH
jgi:phenylacetic acid degradation operon negative regulatory protein